MTRSLLLSLFDEIERRPLTISELTSQVRGALENRFAAVWVEGEISNFRPAGSGHWYFTIKDESSQLRATCFRGVNARIRFRPSDGLQVRARGQLTVYEPRGEYQLSVEALDPIGAGALRVAFDQLRERLAREGLFDAERKRELPLLPRRIAVVTSATGAALRDILYVLKRRAPGTHIVIAPVRVQGEGAGREIARAIKSLSALHMLAAREGREADLIDAMIVGRGGGSAEDLWAFNEEEVARAIVASTIPVVSAVGHETDFTIADFASDVRAPTPSAAAEMVAAREDDLRATIAELSRSLVRAARFRVMTERERANEAAMSDGFDLARERLRDALAEAEGFETRMEAAMRRALDVARRRAGIAERRLTPARLETRAAAARARLSLARAALDAGAEARLDYERGRLSVTVAALDALSPLAVLGRGYALAQDENGRTLRSASDARIGDRVRVHLAEGALDCRVEGVANR